MSAGHGANLSDCRNRDGRMRPVDVVERAAQHIGLSDEVGDEAVARVLVDLARIAELQNLSRVHDRDPVGHGQRFVLIVGHVDEGDADFTVETLELELHRFAQLQIERPQRLVQQQHLRPVYERARERDALLLSA